MTCWLGFSNDILVYARGASLLDMTASRLALLKTGKIGCRCSLVTSRLQSPQPSSRLPNCCAHVVCIRSLQLSTAKHSNKQPYRACTALQSYNHICVPSYHRKGFRV